MISVVYENEVSTNHPITLYCQLQTFQVAPEVLKMFCQLQNNGDSMEDPLKTP